jgi:hypothetical protein
MTNEIGGCQGRTGMRGTTSTERTANEQNSVLIHRKLPWWQLRVPTIAVWHLPQQQNVAITAQSASCASRRSDKSFGSEPTSVLQRQPHEIAFGSWIGTPMRIITALAVCFCCLASEVVAQEIPITMPKPSVYDARAPIPRTTDALRRV